MPVAPPGASAPAYRPTRSSLSTPADTTTRVHASRRVRPRALRGRLPATLRGGSVLPEAHRPGEVPARLPYVVERGARARAYAGRTAGCVCTGVQASSVEPQHAGGHNNTRARLATCPPACFTWSTPGHRARHTWSNGREGVDSRAGPARLLGGVEAHRAVDHAV